MILSTKKIIFVFGSNLAGRHGLGAAKTAVLYFGAKYGIGQGISGNSYGIATKDTRIQILNLKEIEAGVDRFKRFASQSEHKFLVTKVGCGLAGYNDYDVAPMFDGVSENVLLPDTWNEVLGKEIKPFFLMNDACIPNATFELIVDNYEKAQFAFGKFTKMKRHKENVSPEMDRRFPRMGARFGR